MRLMKCLEGTLLTFEKEVHLWQTVEIRHAGTLQVCSTDATSVSKKWDEGTRGLGFHPHYAFPNCHPGAGPRHPWPVCACVFFLASRQQVEDFCYMHVVSESGWQTWI